MPEYDDNEVEIARIALESATAGVISVRASAVSGSIEYSVVDEYDGVFFLPFAHSKEPLTLAELIRLLDDGSMEGNAYPGGLAQSNNLANAGAWHPGLRHFTPSRRTLTPGCSTTTSRSSPRGSRTKRPRTKPGSSRQAGEAHQEEEVRLSGSHAAEPPPCSLGPTAPSPRRAKPRRLVAAVGRQSPGAPTTLVGAAPEDDSRPILVLGRPAYPPAAFILFRLQ